LRIETFPASDFVTTHEVRVPETGEFFRSEAYHGFVRNDGDGFKFGAKTIVKRRETLSDGNDRVVFYVAPEPKIEIALPGKRVLELTPVEATQVLRQLDAVLL
jgi:hypothetical protein